MPKLSASTKTERQQSIIAAARRCFLRNGFANTSMADIVAESGMSPGSIYSHFDGKASILRGTAEDIFHAALQNLATMKNDQGGVPDPTDVGRLVARTLLSNDLPPLLVQFIAESTVNSEVREAALENITRARALLAQALTPWTRQRLDDGVDPGSPTTDPARLANVLMLFVHGLLVRVSVDVEADVDRLIDDAFLLLPGETDAA